VQFLEMSRQSCCILVVFSDWLYSPPRALFI